MTIIIDGFTEQTSNAIIIAIKPISYVEMNEWMMNDLFSSVFTNFSVSALFVCFNPFHFI